MIEPAHEAHRGAFMAFVLADANPRLRPLLQHLYECFNRWNAQFFENRLIPPHILIAEPKAAKAAADYSPVSGWGSSSQIRIRPAIITGHWPGLREGNHDAQGLQRYTEDVLLHELVHQWCEEILRKPETAEKGHGPVFAGECTRISALLGLPGVGQARAKRRTPGLQSCTFWPTCVRSQEYYLGAYRPDLRGLQTTVAHNDDEPDTLPVSEQEEREEQRVDGTMTVLSVNEWQTLWHAVAPLPVAALFQRLALYHGQSLVMPDCPPLSALDAPQQALFSLTDAQRDVILERITLQTPSAYQLALFGFVLFGTGNGIVNAVAGSGKTTSLVQCARLISGEALFLAFNKHIARELEERLRGTQTVAKTIHSIGYGCCTRALGKLQLDDRKYEGIARAYFRAHMIVAESTLRKLVQQAAKLCDFARLTLTNPHDAAAMHQLLEHYQLEIEAEYHAAIMESIPRLLAEGQRTAEQEKRIDFTDQIWLPAVLHLQPRQVGFVFVDECQDLNAAQLDLAIKCCAAHGRMLFVGDPHQCQPAGTRVRMANGQNRAIEDLQVGDKIVTYDRSSASFVKNGVIKNIAHRSYHGLLYTVSIGRKQTQCTNNHKWLVRWTGATDGNCWVTYIMRQGSRYRVGQTQMYLKRPLQTYNTYDSGLTFRANTEKADAAWILKVHHTYAEALAYEQIVATQYGIPQVIFKSFSGVKHYTQPVIDSIYEAIGDIESRAKKCLEDHGRDMAYPLYDREKRQRQGRNTLFLTEACNLISGYMAVNVCPDNVCGGDRACNWQALMVTSQPYEGIVYSLQVAKHELYVADGLLTHNSIMGFAGADNRSFWTIQERAQATLIPLSICYRCPTSHIQLAQALVPHIEARPGAPAGTITTILEKDLAKHVSAGDMVICRLTAPLVSNCIQLIAQRIPAKVKGREVGKSLTTLITTILDSTQARWQNFGRAIDQYANGQRAKLQQRANSESALERLNDSVEAIRVCYEAFDAGSAEALIEEINALFSDEQSSVTLATVHRTKGLEAQRIFIVRPDKLPLRWEKQAAWELEQEQNLRYVALTRAKEALFFVEAKSGS